MSDEQLGDSNVSEQSEDKYGYWRDIIIGGGCTTIPRWTHDPTPGIGHEQVAIPDGLASDLGRLTDRLHAPLDTVMLAAWAKVLSAMAGEDEVTTGYVATGESGPLPCRLSTEPASWRALVARVGAAASQVRQNADVSVHDLKAELGLTEPDFEAVCDPTGIGGDLDENTKLWVGLRRDGTQLSLAVRFRTDALDAAYAHRIIGYHLAVFSAMTANPDEEHTTQSLLSSDELYFQLETLQGPKRELPHGRFHELFEQQVAFHPTVTAAVHGDRRWSYRQLNARANQLGRALQQRGVTRETIVGVITERNLDWMASVLAIFKAGGVYLPIEPHFPPDRIATTLSRADCSLVITESESSANLDRALESLDGVQRLEVDAAYAEGHSDRNLGVAVTEKQLAYIYFTSGSTGQPKGAMCEHDGMLNHLYAKIDDLAIGPGEVIAQIAPQCFDISLWQLVSALLVGGRTELIHQDTLLNPDQFIDRIIEAEVAVLQVVPSYLEVLLSWLELHPCDLPDLHCVSVTGEALSVELTRRFFAVLEGVKLVNAYGLTETSDDTNHEVMLAPPSGPRVPLGRVVNNVEVRIVDEQLRPVPLGAPGEIVFSGICVGRGYINDPDRTRAAFMPDPLRAGQRLYRSGDFGCWRPDRKLEFLGRRDAQVKIRGFRIEIGEIENAMLGLPGVRQAAVVITERAGRGKQLDAFYSGKDYEARDVQKLLGRTLPSYMVPPAIHWREDLPLTDNGKVNKKTLRALAETLDAPGESYEQPATEAEKRLATAWSTILEIPLDQIGRGDSFFDLGGSSLSAVELVIALDGSISLKDATRHPVLHEQAALFDRTGSDHSGLLQLLSEPDEAPQGTLVCFPYAGGNAVNYHAMAAELRGTGLAIYALELPGHQLRADGEPFAEFEHVIQAATAEIADLDPACLVIWGHSSGAAFAIETARRLEQTGVDVQTVFVGAQMLGDVVGRTKHMAQLDDLTDAEIAAALSTDSGYSELGELGADHARRVGAALRHDCVSAHRYLIDAIQDPPTDKLSAPLVAVVAEDDSSVGDSSDRYGDWGLLAQHVERLVLEDGGHYFLRTRPAQSAEIVLRLTMAMTPS